MAACVVKYSGSKIQNPFAFPMGPSLNPATQSKNQIENRPQSGFHPSIEGAQHGAKSLTQFLEYAKKSGASGAQPSNYMLQSEKGFKSAQEIKDAFAKAKLRLDGISTHCPFWVHTTAWTHSPTIRPFTPAD